MWKDKLFWFSQPSIILTSYDRYILWFFLSLLSAGIILKLISKFLVRHPVTGKLWNKLSNAGIITGLLGLLWYAFRYENIPFFADRYWALAMVAIFLVWLIFILRYLIMRFRAEKNSYDRMQLNSKYIPGPRR